ncbi:hypothetical protein AXZ77_2354 [Thioclava sp. ES.031]|nr:hypothetical protein AXZ77_2354 [Thioclava sp. ES.031]
MKHVRNDPQLYQKREVKAPQRMPRGKLQLQAARDKFVSAQMDSDRYIVIVADSQDDAH